MIPLQRSGARILPPLLALAYISLAAASAWGAAKTYTVNSTADVANATSTSPNCAIAGSSACTLRAAIQASNNNSPGNGANTILIPTAGTYFLTIPGRNEDAAATGDLDILN